MAGLQQTKESLLEKYERLPNEFLTGALVVAGIALIIFALLSKNLLAKAVVLAYVTLP